MSKSILPGFGVAFLLVSCLSCDDYRETPFSGYVTRSASFEYHNETSESLCPTLMPLLDRHLSSFESANRAPSDTAILSVLPFQISPS